MDSISSPSSEGFRAGSPVLQEWYQGVMKKDTITFVTTFLFSFTQIASYQ